MSRKNKNARSVQHNQRGFSRSLTDRFPKVNNASALFSASSEMPMSPCPSDAPVLTWSPSLKQLTGGTSPA